MKRAFDFVVSLFLIIAILPILFVISLVIVSGSRGGVIYRQIRVGKNNKDFKILKFRTMFTDSDKKGLLTVGMNDSRITPAGRWLRKHKIDELPQLLNVFWGDMSIVGPRPEVRKYVELYTPEQMKVLTVRPGITDFASLKYHKENEVLSMAENPEEMYVQKIMPEKINLNLKYIEQCSLWTDVKIIFRTIAVVFK